MTRCLTLALASLCLAAPPDEDCDGNGIDDAAEIRLAPDLDQNENGSLDACEQRAGDLDLSERIDFGDVNLALLEMGSPGGPADLDRDGQVDLQDVALVLLEFGPSPRASVPRGMLADLLAHRAHVDLVVLGDSNATFSMDGSRGYAGGWFDELTRRGLPLYATGLLPTASTGTKVSYPLMGLTGEETTAAASVTVHDGIRPQDGWQRASVSGGSLQEFQLRSQVAPLRLEGREIDWAFLPEGADTQGHAPEWIGLAKGDAGTPQFTSQCSGAFRVLVARLPSSTPEAPRAPLRLHINAQTSGWPAVIPPLEIPTRPQAGPEIVAFEARYPADPRREGIFASYRVDDGSAGPLGVLVRSLYRTDGKPGYAIHVLQNHAGGTSTEIALSIDDDSGCGLPTLRTYLKELRSRQRAAGGAGRVLVFLNMGINNAGANSEHASEETCAEDVAAMVAQLDRAWASLGHPPEDLGFIVTASHDGGIDGYRADLATERLRQRLAGDRHVAIIDVDALAPRHFLAANRLFAGGMSDPDAHLSREGYRRIVQGLITRLHGAEGASPREPGLPSN